MRILLAISFMFLFSCGYDGSIGRLKQDLKDDEIPVETQTEALESQEKPENHEQVAEVPEEIKDEDGVVLLTERDFQESCTPGFVEGDFAVSVEVSEGVEFKAFFNPDSGCDHAFIDYQHGVVQGGVCSNDGEFLLFDVDAKPVRLVLTRREGQITWEIYTEGKEYERLQYLTIKDDFAGSTTFCKYD